jgi:hypothetical protein
MKKGTLFLAIGVAMLLPVTAAQASLMNGSEGFVLFSVSTAPNANNVDACTSVNWGMMGTNGVGGGDFSTIPALTWMHSWTPVTLSNLSAWTFEKPGFGTWTTTGGNVTRPGSGLLHVSLTGTFTPDFGGFTASPGTAELSVNQSGGSVTGGLTFAVTPEPATLSLLALGGLAMLRRRR